MRSRADPWFRDEKEDRHVIWELELAWHQAEVQRLLALLGRAPWREDQTPFASAVEDCVARQRAAFERSFAPYLDLLTEASS